jgi:glycosyltransferase involved in cell wall biosynthesis
MRIAFFNWRDIRHPTAGGAEVYVHNIMKCLRAKGHRVTLFSSSFPGSAEHDIIDGIEHVRYGGRFLIYPKAILCYRRHIEGRYDVIVESINGVPFFIPLFAKEKVVPLVHQLTRENWYSALPAPLAFVGYHLEDHLLRLYARCTAVAPSQSTKSDLEMLGFKNVRIVHGAADVEPPKKATKESSPTLMYLGRITRSKRPDHVLRAFRKVRDSIPDAVLWVVGSGSEEERVRQLAQSLGIGGNVRFFGKVSERKKAELLSRAHILLLPAVREGWGLVVLEANACGTPVVGYRVHGLRDSIKDGVNGLLADDGDVTALALCVSSMLSDRRALQALSASSLRYARSFSWERSAEEFLSLAEAPL